MGKSIWPGSWNLVLLWTKLREDFSPGHFLGLVGKLIIVGLLLDEDLMIENQSFDIAKKIDRHDILAVAFKPIEKMCTAILAKAAFGPIRRIEDRNVVFVIEGNLGSAIHGKKRPATPFSARPAMACADFLVEIGNIDLRLTAKARPHCFDWVRHCCLLLQCE
ncbi:MAG: hypothetical protein ACRBM6_17925 [Geminicoccales bacterium]